MKSGLFLYLRTPAQRPLDQQSRSDLRLPATRGISNFVYTSSIVTRRPTVAAAH